MTNRVLHITVSIKEEQIPVNVDIIDDTTIPLEISVQDGIGGGKLPYYDGSYEIEPRKVEQVLLTRNKSMSDNVTVEAIHYAEVENPSGGITAVIGFE